MACPCPSPYGVGGSLTYEAAPSRDVLAAQRASTMHRVANLTKQGLTARVIAERMGFEEIRTVKRWRRKARAAKLLPLEPVPIALRVA